MIGPFYSQHPLEMRLCGPQSLSGRCVERAMIDTEIGYEDVSCIDLVRKLTR
jgi:hypothetical protein